MFRTGIIVAALLASKAWAQSAPEHAAHAAADARQAEIARRGAAVMPFDLERTLHRFTPTGTGGVQSVMSADKDAAQVRLVREHLKAEASRFSRGDYSSPAAIHGREMPGLAVLSAGAARMKVSYVELPAGAELRFESADPHLVEALHAWFAAQVSDHGRHAVAGHTH